MAYQKIIIRGNLGGDPDVRYTQSGTAVANFSVAVGEKWKDKQSGQVQEHTEWFKCSAFGATGENIGKYFSKGSGILVEGKMRTQKYQDKVSGEDKYSVQLIVSQFDFIDSKSGAQQSTQAPQQQPSQQGAPPAGAEFDDETIPF